MHLSRNLAASQKDSQQVLSWIFSRFSVIFLANIQLLIFNISLLIHCFLNNISHSIIKFIIDFAAISHQPFGIFSQLQYCQILRSFKWILVTVKCVLLVAEKHKERNRHIDNTSNTFQFHSNLTQIQFQIQFQIQILPFQK